jgi:hypothetical protein
MEKNHLSNSSHFNDADLVRLTVNQNNKKGLVDISKIKFRPTNFMHGDMTGVDRLRRRLVE